VGGCLRRPPVFYDAEPSICPPPAKSAFRSPRSHAGGRWACRAPLAPPTKPKPADLGRPTGSAVKNAPATAGPHGHGFSEIIVDTPTTLGRKVSIRRDPPEYLWGEVQPWLIAWNPPEHEVGGLRAEGAQQSWALIGDPAQLRRGPEPDGRPASLYFPNRSARKRRSALAQTPEWRRRMLSIAGRWLMREDVVTRPRLSAWSADPAGANAEAFQGPERLIYRIIVSKSARNYRKTRSAAKGPSDPPVRPFVSQAAPPPPTAPDFGRKTLWRQFEAPAPPSSSCAKDNRVLPTSPIWTR